MPKPEERDDLDVRKDRNHNDGKNIAASSGQGDRYIINDKFIQITNESIVTGNDSIHYGRLGIGKSVMNGKAFKISGEKEMDPRVESLLRKNKKIREMYGRVKKRFSE